jgi:hypothetical protein
VNQGPPAESQAPRTRRRPPAHVWLSVLFVLCLLGVILLVATVTRALQEFAAISAFFTSVVAVLLVIAAWDLKVSIWGGRYLVYGSAGVRTNWWRVILPWFLLVGFIFGHCVWR